jgi:hypothetical protein
MASKWFNVDLAQLRTWRIESLSWIEWPRHCLLRHHERHDEVSFRVQLDVPKPIRPEQKYGGDRMEGMGVCIHEVSSLE